MGSVFRLLLQVSLLDGDTLFIFDLNSLTSPVQPVRLSFESGWAKSIKDERGQGKMQVLAETGQVRCRCWQSISLKAGSGGHDLPATLLLANELPRKKISEE